MATSDAACRTSARSSPVGRQDDRVHSSAPRPRRASAYSVAGIVATRPLEVQIGAASRRCSSSTSPDLAGTQAARLPWKSHGDRPSGLRERRRPAPAPPQPAAARLVQWRAVGERSVRPAASGCSVHRRASRGASGLRLRSRSAPIGPGASLRVSFEQELAELRVELARMRVPCGDSGAAVEAPRRGRAPRPVRR